MRDMKKYLDAEAKRELEASRAILRTAEDEGRVASSEELEQVEAHVAKAQEAKSRASDMERDDDLQERIKSLSGDGTNGPAPTPAPEAKTIGERFTKSDGYQALKARGTGGGNWTTGPVEFGGAKDDAPMTLDSTDFSGPGNGNVHPQIVPGVIGPVEQQLYVADLFGSGVATQNTIVFMRESLTEKGVLDSSGVAVVTDEASDKAQANLEFEKDSVSVEKLAAFLAVSDEMIEDEPQIASYINGRLPLFVRQAEEAKLVADLLGAGIESAEAGDVGGDNSFDAIAAAIMTCQVEGGLQPDSLVINPADFWAMAVMKAVAGDGNYFSGGPYAGPARNPWGLATVITTAVTAGSPIVGAFKTAATVWRKGGLSVELSNSHADYFRKNLTAIRAEERVALSVYRPEAFVEVTLPSA